MEITIKNKYVKADNNILINEQCIRWIKKIDDCLYVCSKSSGCAHGETLPVCKQNNVDSYNKLKTHFD
jgi:hypothetical protein